MSDTTLVMAPTMLSGAHVRLEPLSRSHIEGLLAAAREDLSLYRWSTIPALSYPVTFALSNIILTIATYVVALLG